MSHFLRDEEKEVILKSVITKLEMSDNYHNRREMYNIQDDRIGSVGPMDVATLKMWRDSGMVDPKASVLEVGSTVPMSVEQVIETRPPQGPPPQDWYLWTDTKSPFNNMVNRVNKCFTSRQSLSDVKMFSIQNSQVSLTAVQDFELFLEQGFEISPMVQAMNLNQLAQPFAQWVVKTFSDLKANVNEQEIRQFLLNTDPQLSRKFIFSKIQPESNAQKFFSVYNQWRVYIPIYNTVQ